jgi:hypothetical protein
MRPQEKSSTMSPAKIKRGKKKVRPSISIDSEMISKNQVIKPHTNGDSKMNPTGIHDKKA